MRLRLLKAQHEVKVAAVRKPTVLVRPDHIVTLAPRQVVVLRTLARPQGQMRLSLARHKVASPLPILQAT